MEEKQNPDRVQVSDRARQRLGGMIARVQSARAESAAADAAAAAAAKVREVADDGLTLLINQVLEGAGVDTENGDLYDYDGREFVRRLRAEGDVKTGV